MGRIQDLAERCWQGEFAGNTIGLLAATFEIDEVAPDLFFLHGFANVTAARTDAGLVLVDTGIYIAKDKTFAAVRGVAPDPVYAAVYTHGHVDHAFGMPPFLDEAESKGWAAPKIVGHENVAGRFDRYRLTRGYNGCINARQFSAPGTIWPERYDYPDTVYEDSLTLEAGADRLALRHAKGETDDHTWVHWAERKTLFTGDQFIWVTPNAGNPQKAQRYPAEWAASLREMAECNAELLIPGHGPPIFGAARVRQALEDTAAWLEHLVSETLERMNAGLPLDVILQEVKPDAALSERPYLTPVYDHPEYVVRNIWRLYGGWYDGTPSHLAPAPEAVLGRELAEMAGGAKALAGRGRVAAEAGDLRLACHLLDWAAAAAPEDASVHEIRADVYRRRAKASSALMSKGVYNAAARESQEKAGGEG